MASILTGLYLSAHTAEKIASNLSPSVETLGEILSRNGYATTAVISHKLLSSKRGFGQGFERFVEEDARGHEYVSSRNVTKNAIELLDALAADPLPTEAELRFLRSVYDEEIRFTDGAIGELLDALRARELYSDSLIVFTADHGEEFLDHGWWGHSRNLYDSVIHVPLVVKLPSASGRGKVIEAPVSLVGIAPTILDVIGLSEHASRMQSESLEPLLQGGSSDRPVYSEVAFDARQRPKIWAKRRSADMRAVIRGRYKLIHDRGTDLYEFYDRARDPGEKRDLAATRPELTRELRRELDGLSERAAAIRPMTESTHVLDQDGTEPLRQLGYIED